MFKVGDKVVCVDNTDNEGIITLGQTYTIEYINDNICNIEERPEYDWFLTRFQLALDIDPLVEIHQSEYSALIDEINLLQELLSEANIKLAGLESKPSEEFKPVSEYTMEDWSQALRNNWEFECRGGNIVTIQGLDGHADDSRPVLCSVGWYHNLNGMWDESTGVDNDDIIKRIK